MRCDKSVIQAALTFIILTISDFDALAMSVMPKQQRTIRTLAMHLPAQPQLTPIEHEMLNDQITDQTQTGRRDEVVVDVKLAEPPPSHN